MHEHLTRVAKAQHRTVSGELRFLVEEHLKRMEKAS